MSAFPPWLNALHPTDRAVARRWLSEAGGEARLARIAAACRGHGRRRGRPSADTEYASLVLNAAIVWMTDPADIDFGEAAGRVVGEAKRLASEAAIRRRIRTELENADLEFWRNTEKIVTGRGIVARRSPLDFGGLPPPMLPAGIRRMMQQHALLLRQQNAYAARFTPRLPSGHATFQNICALVEGFDEMPAHEALYWLGDVANAWAARKAPAGPI